MTLITSAPQSINQLCLGDGRNDAKMRIYGCCDNGHLYEWTFSGGYSLTSDLEAPPDNLCMGGGIPAEDSGR